MNEEILNKVREFVAEEFEKPETLRKSSFDSHFKIVVKYGLELAEDRGADAEVVEIAAWLHDVGSVRGQHENHHIVGAEIADKLLNELGYPCDRIEMVKHCILTHRGSRVLDRETKEAQVLADADAMSHFDDIDGITERFYGGDEKKTLEKLERSYVKLSDETKPLVFDKLVKAQRDLQ